MGWLFIEEFTCFRPKHSMPYMHGIYANMPYMDGLEVHHCASKQIRVDSEGFPLPVASVVPVEFLALHRGHVQSIQERLSDRK